MKALPYAQFGPANLGDIRPAGWLETFLQRQCAGLTGHPAASGLPFGHPYWGATAGGPESLYAGWWPYEQTGYWIDGALKAGYLAGDTAVYQQALAEIAFAVQHSAADGFIGPKSMREKDRWAHAVFFRAVLAQYEISGDPGYLQSLRAHYHALPHPMLWDRDVTGVEILAQLYAETGDEALRTQALDLYARFNQAFPGHDCSLKTLHSEKVSHEHGVTFNEIAKLGALLYGITGEAQYLDACQHGYAKLERDQLLADGLHSCSEHLRGRDALDSHETCDISDYTWALGYLLQVSGEAHYADRIEQVIFNALPGSITKDFRALQYFSCPNQVVADSHSNHNLFQRGFNWMAFRPDHEVQCCPGNVHRAMPNYVARMWQRTPGGGIVAACYGAGELRCQVEDVGVTVHAETAYPFEQEIRFTFHPERPRSFTFSLRIPGWCQQAEILLNDQPLDLDLQPGSFYPLERTWQPGDRLTLRLPFTLRLERWPQGGISLSYGPLTMSLPVRAEAAREPANSTLRQREEIHGPNYVAQPYERMDDFPGWELGPASDWNYALCLDEASLERVQVHWQPGAAYPLDGSPPPVVLRVPARKVQGWDVIRTSSVDQQTYYYEGGKYVFGIRPIAGEFALTPSLPESLVGRLSEDEEWIELVPYGCTLLRMTVFPQC
jgi:hypothetical protein